MNSAVNRKLEKIKQDLERAARKRTKPRKRVRKPRSMVKITLLKAKIAHSELKHCRAGHHYRPVFIDWSDERGIICLICKGSAKRA